MRSATKIAAFALVITMLAGCGHKKPRAVTPPAAQAPSVPPGEMATLTPPVPQQIPAGSQPPVKLDTAPPPETEAAVKPPPRRRPSRRHRSAPQETAQQAAPKVTAPPPSPPADTQVASGKQPSEDSPIGQLSTANDSANTADRRALVDLINSIETGLNAIRRPLDSDEQKTATQVRTFITRAREALKVDDLDGAHTLATKAHLLLEELKKE